ncbi:hypothetical protein K7X08_008093 [Anisodus acutangulus]|uniref:Uncharacterized protein n=1 Tax=Anisodus acutangulus TaxID=402998 RepID=A0A9Q1MPQ3_9SOLA|nr:hypothetical protein K7X08_008093 [Anisodus acutangulus]
MALVLCPSLQHNDNYSETLLKVDKMKLIELCGTSDSEFANDSTSMNEVCFDVFGTSNEKKDPKTVKGNRELLDALPEKRRENGNKEEVKDFVVEKRDLLWEDYEKGATLNPVKKQLVYC